VNEGGGDSGCENKVGESRDPTKREMPQNKASTTKGQGKKVGGGARAASAGSEVSPPSRKSGNMEKAGGAARNEGNQWESGNMR